MIISIYKTTMMYRYTMKKYFIFYFFFEQRSISFIDTNIGIQFQLTFCLFRSRPNKKDLFFFFYSLIISFHFKQKIFGLI